MNVNEKGSIGLIKVVNDLYSKGFHCFLPFDDYGLIDCIALNKEGKSFKLQVKYRNRNIHNFYEVTAESVINGKRVPYIKGIIDYWAIYLADLDRVLYLDNKVFDKQNSFRLTTNRINEPDDRIKSEPC